MLRIPLAAALLVLGVAGCGSSESHPHPTPTRSPISELDPDSAPAVRRTDALTVAGPSEAPPGPIRFSLTVPPPLDGVVIELRVSGTCRAVLHSSGDRRGRVQGRAGQGVVVVFAALPTARDTCHTVLDALVPGRAETGDGADITVRRQQ